jgi:Glycosyltransferase family 87
MDGDVGEMPPSDRGAMPRLRLIFWASLALVSSLINGPAFVHSLKPAPTEGLDFFQEWSSARNWREGIPVYTDIDQLPERYMGIPRGEAKGGPFKKNAHPPTSVLLSLPFAWMTYPNAMLAWNLMSLGAFLLSLRLIARELGVAVEAWMVLPLIALGLFCNPLRQQVNQGQLNLVLLLWLIGTWSAARRGHPAVAGILLGTATAFKLFPAFVTLFFLIRRCWRVVAIATLTAFILTVVTVIVFGLDTYRDYLFKVVPEMGAYRSVWLNASLQGFWVKWFGVGATQLDLPSVPPLVHAPIVARVGIMISSIAILVLWFNAVRRLSFDHGFSVTLIVMLLLSPVTWDHYMLLLTLPIVHVWRAFPEPRWERVALIGVLIALWPLPMIFREPTLTRHRVFFHLGTSVLFGALLALFLLGLRLADDQGGPDGGARQLSTRSQ